MRRIEHDGPKRAQIGWRDVVAFDVQRDALRYVDVERFTASEVDDGDPHFVDRRFFAFARPQDLNGRPPR